MWDTSPGVPGSEKQVRAVCIGPAGNVYVGGRFTSIGGVEARSIAVWDGSSWSPLGSGVNDSVEALTFYDDGTGPALFAAGLFSTAGGISAKGVAKWTGSAWEPLGSGLGGNGIGFALAVYDDGSGPKLVVGGSFTGAGAVPDDDLALWDGSSWSSIGDVVGAGAAVAALAVDGSTLYVGGAFLGIQVPSDNVILFDGANWVEMDGGVDGDVWSMEVGDDGTLYVGGDFDSPASRIAKWDGASWSSLGAGVTDPSGIVRDILWHDDGTGPALIVAGSFRGVDGILASRLAKWSAGVWTEHLGGADDTIVCLAPGDDGSLAVVGFFEQVGSSPANRVARITGCAASGPSPDINGDGVVDAADLAALLGTWGEDGPGDLNSDGDTDAQDLAVLLGSWG